jgi:hypothetical protein
LRYIHGSMASLSPQRRPISVFISYSRRDAEEAAIAERLAQWLEPLVYKGDADVWYDRDLVAADHWDATIRARLEAADLILLLVSPSFLASEYCQIEMGIALKHPGARVAPIILRPCAWKRVVGHLQALPRGHELLREKDLDGAFAELAGTIEKMIEDPSSRQAQPAPTARWSQGLERQSRLLEAAIKRRVFVGLATEVLVMICRERSGGLRAHVKTGRFSPSAGDVRSAPVEIEFPVRAEGALGSLRLSIRLEGPDFEPQQQVKEVEIPPDRDSPIYEFLVSPMRSGELTLHVELVAVEISAGSRTIRTLAIAVAEVTPPPAEYEVVSIPMMVSLALPVKAMPSRSMRKRSLPLLSAFITAGAAIIAAGIQTYWRQPGPPPPPTRVEIRIVNIPPFDPIGGEATYPTSIAGIVRIDHPERYRVVIYALGGDTWFVQPFDNQPMTPVGADGSWRTNIHRGRQYAALLVTAAYSPPPRTPALPDTDVLAKAEVDGKR